MDVTDLLMVGIGWLTISDFLSRWNWHFFRAQPGCCKSKIMSWTPRKSDHDPKWCHFFSGKDGLIFDLFGFQSFADTSNWMDGENPAKSSSGHMTILSKLQPKYVFEVIIPSPVHIKHIHSMVPNLVFSIPYIHHGWGCSVCPSLSVCNYVWLWVSAW